MVVILTPIVLMVVGIPGYIFFGFRFQGFAETHSTKWPFGDAFGNWFGTSTWKVKKATFSDGREGVVYQDTAPEVNVTWLSVYVYYFLVVYRIV